MEYTLKLFDVDLIKFQVSNPHFKWGFNFDRSAV